jgi:hypothetical protein
MHLKVGKLDVEVGSMRVRVGHLWLPDGLHVWWGEHPLHLFWSRSWARACVRKST